ncbi:hypothetical protein FF2_040025 [Malus domestica]
MLLGRQSLVSLLQGQGSARYFRLKKSSEARGQCLGPKYLFGPRIPYEKVTMDRLVHGLPNLGRSSHVARRVIESWRNKESRQDMDIDNPEVNPT